MSVGVLNQRLMRAQLIDSNPARIKSSNAIDQTLLDPSAIDLPLGTKFFEMKASCRPGQRYAVKDLIKVFKRSEGELKPGTCLTPRTIYLIEAAWSLDLPKNICARATAKSSIGRLDALVRLVADYESEFETVSRQQPTNLWLEVRPNTFSLKVSPGDALSQLRFIKGDEEHCTVSPEVLDFEDEPPLVDKAGNRVQYSTGVGDRNSVLLHLERLSE